MNFRKVNNITGWGVFFIAFLTYFLTREARGSLWDCGEFVSCAYHLQLPHPPGAPMFTLLGRFFVILFGDNGHTAANAVNTMSALASAATILFLFWSITHFARKMFVSVGEELSSSQKFTVMAAGVVGGLAYTFSDSFWFSAGEGEVYALSSFFTALVFWLMLKWEHSDEKAGNDPFARARSDRWIVVLFFMMGLSIGVHLLNLLTIPAIVMIYYYRRYQASTKGAIVAFILGCLITGLVQVGVIQYSMKAAGYFDIFFTNKIGMPFFTGFALYFIALAALIAWALRFTEKNITPVKLISWFSLFLFLTALPFVIVPGDGLKFLRLLLILAAATAAGYFMKPSALRVIKLSLWCYAFMMLGYFMYFTSLIRSNSNPAVDMNNVDNPINLVYYLSREQYGDAPLLYGPHFAANYRDDDGDRKVDMKEGAMRYIKGKDKYIPTGRDMKPLYEKSDMQVFPRIWDASNDQGHAQAYAEWLGLAQDEQGRYEAPSYADNFEWFITYQMGFMYWRYFMWNFAGKQNDIQGFSNKRDGNWISGISFIDNQRLGDQSKLPESLKNNKAKNKLYMLPFILGIVGCVYQFLRNKKDWVVNFLLFFMTGIAVVIYLNQPGSQPRERDYAYVSSFYVFALWIGLAVVAFVRLAREKADKMTFQNTLLFGAGLTFLITFMSCASEEAGDGLLVSIFATVLYAAVTAAITYLVRMLSSGGQNARMLNISTAVVCMLVPLLMAQQEWDDHDRSRKTTAPDIAKDYLESCAPNAIIFTFGDNDTYPLWYAQEVEGIRPDIRIINNSLLGIDWYINQLRYAVNKSDSLNVILTPEQIEGDNRARIYYQKNPGVNETLYYPIHEIIDYIGKKTTDPKTGRDSGPETLPVKRYKISVDTALTRKNGGLNATDSILSEMYCEYSKNYLDRNEIIILNIIESIAKDGWRRPIYFTHPYGDLGFGQYLRKDGLAYRLVPVGLDEPQRNWVTDQTMRAMRMGGSIRNNNTDTMYNNLLNKFEFGGADKKGLYFDEENRRHILSMRSAFAEAAGNLADKGRIEEAQKLLNKVEQGISTENLPYAMVSRINQHNQTAMIYLEACYKAGKNDVAEKVRTILRKDMEQQKAYYIYMNGGIEPTVTRSGIISNTKKFEGLKDEWYVNDLLLEVLLEVEKKYAPGVIPKTGEGQTPVINPPRPNDGATKKDTGKNP
ncbi:MAG: DUF2723 domain-containing protein [Chitinophagaceae bacterium]|nr:DUF2723 domain-containing protein [Chitinophagaceae bacterium]